MLLTAIGKGAAAGALYPEFIGRRALMVASTTGPASYSQTTADPVVLNLPNYYIDWVSGDLSVSGTYYVRFQSSGVGARQTWKARWYVTATSAEVANGVNLSAETLNVMSIVGQF